ncbi:MAG: cyanophycinase [Cyclobacteriaceae bacterium]
MKFALLLLLTSLVCTSAIAQTTGPEKGSLVIVGGGQVGPEIINKFIELAGGPNAKIVVIPTAAGRAKYDESNNSYQLFKKAGATNLTLLHTDDPNVANTPKFTAPLKNADAVWFGGGRQWRLVDSYGDTESEELFWKVLDRGGVIGGSSAGATIQGSYLARGDTENNQIMMGDHEEGFGFVENIAIDQHVLARNRQFDLFEIIREKPELLGIGIDESTAVVVKKNRFEVIGQSYVLIYDNNFWSREGSDLKKLPAKENTFYMLRSGDKYDMKARKVIE